MKTTLKKIQTDATKAIKKTRSLGELDLLKPKYLGKKGALTDVLKQLKDVAPKDRASIGQIANEIKMTIISALETQTVQLEEREWSIRLEKEAIDVTLPGRSHRQGTRHPIMHVENECVAIFKELGYSLAAGPEIENEYYNFEALNIPADHPARDMHDTFYLNTNELLRTHTSPVQIREMSKKKPPIKIIVPGKVFRCDADSSHSPVFHQLEGLLVDEQVTFSDLKGTIETFLHRFFGADKKVRFRPSYFPFTVPSCEVDVEWKSGWLEIMGAGIVHPNVFKSVGYNPSNVSGFAFGVGLDRLAMLRYEIDDIRFLYDNDYRFLQQFKGL